MPAVPAVSIDIVVDSHEEKLIHALESDHLQKECGHLYFDIETSANVGLFWTSGYKISIGTENIIKERAVICICYKFYAAVCT